MAIAAPRTPPRVPMSRRPDGPPEAESAVTTIALVGETKTPWGTAAVAACLAELAVTDELVVVYGSEAHGSEANGSGPGVHTLVAELRGHLPRYTIAALYLAPYDGALGRDADLLTELVETGVLPVVVTPAGT